MENQDNLAAAVAEMRGEMRAIRELFGIHTTQDMEQFTALRADLKELSVKLDALLLREAERQGEFKGVKRTVTVLASVISLFFSAVGAVAGHFLF